MNGKRPVYLDANATTPVDPAVLEIMLPYFNHEFGNAASIDHMYGQKAGEAVKEGRGQVALAIGARPEEIIFTSGATESDNLAIIGAVEANAGKGDHVITCVTEHKAVLDTCKRLEELGKKVTYLPVDHYGQVDPKDVEEAITAKTVLISIMTANNEIGTIAPLRDIGKIARKHGVLFHSDAAQAVGHMPIDVESMNIDLLSISAHKVYGPKGVGALYVRRRNPKVSLSPIIYGGGHERGLRSGTLNTPGIVGLGAALAIANARIKNETRLYSSWTKAIYESLSDKLVNVQLNGHPTNRLSHNLNVLINGVEAKALIHMLREDIAMSSGSACTSNSVEPSHVLLSLGRSDAEAYCSIRLGVGRLNDDADIEFATERIIASCQRLRRFI